MSDSVKLNESRWTANRKVKVVLALFKSGDASELCCNHDITKSQMRLNDG